MSTDIQQPSWAADLHPPRWYWFLPLLLPIVVVALLYYQSTQVLPRLVVIPGFSLMDQAGKPLTSEAMRGNLVIYAFPPADCAAPCSDTTSALHQIRQALGDSSVGGIPLHFVTVSSDQLLAANKVRIDTNTVGPETGTEIDTEADHWHFVSADAGQFRTMIEVQAPSDASLSAEGVAPRFALADGWGIVRALYTTPDLDRIQDDLRSVAREANNSSGVNRYAYEAVHLFLCHNNIVAPQ